MTYSSNLDPAIPGQGEFVRLGAGRIRALTLALKERLESIFVDADADPLVFKPTLMPVKAHVEDNLFGVGSIVAANSGLHLTIVLTTPLPANSPVIAGWKGVVSTAIVQPLNLTAWCLGAVLHFIVYNPTGSAIDVTGETLMLTVLIPVS